MKNVYIILTLLFTFTTVINAQQPSDNKIQAKSSQISKKLKLDDDTSILVYNVVKHISNRIEDLEIGTANYAKLINYIAEEREQMMKSALSKEKYKEYQKLYADKDNNEITRLINKNESFLKKEKVKADREERKAEIAAKREAKKVLASDRKKASKTLTES